MKEQVRKVATVSKHKIYKNKYSYLNGCCIQSIWEDGSTSRIGYIYVYRYCCSGILLYHETKTKNEGKNSSVLSQQKSGESSNSDAMGKDDDVVKSIEGFLNDLEKDTRQDTKAN